MNVVSVNISFNVTVTAKFNDQLVRSASFILSSPLHLQPLLSIALQLQPFLSVALQLQALYGVPSTSTGAATSNNSVRRHGIRREAVRLRPVQLRLQTCQLPAEPQTHPQDRRFQVGT